MTEKEFRRIMKDNGWAEPVIQSCVDAHNESAIGEMMQRLNFTSCEARLERYGAKHISCDGAG